jgi:threonyl-tRNA synthetase
MLEQKLDTLDHRSLGNHLGLFFFSDFTPGMAFWKPNGMRLRKNLERILWKAHIDRDYYPIMTPRMMDVELWKISGHHENYHENMFFSEVEKREYAIAPMNCPGHVLTYQSEVRSYRDFPMKLFEFGLVHRNEASGALHGLFRVRSFTQDDAHLMVLPNQLSEEIEKVMEFVDTLLTKFGFSYQINLSTRPEKSVGSDENWEKAENSIIVALNNIGKDFLINEGDGAFYGPKIDIKIKDCHNREWQLSTIQIDFNLPERFGMKYTDSDGDIKTPIMIHRAILGSFERFIGILLEHTCGLLPVAISPNQAVIVPISSESHKQMTYVKEVKERLNQLGANVEIFDSHETLNKRIKQAEELKNPIIIIIGDSEADLYTLNIRHKIKQKRYEINLEDFITEMKEELTFSI